MPLLFLQVLLRSKLVLLLELVFELLFELVFELVFKLVFELVCYYIKLVFHSVSIVPR